MLRKLSLKKIVGFVLAAGVLAASTSAHASIITDGIFTPTITSGAPPDSPGARVDPNTPTSAYSGVVSLNMRYNGNSFICSGALVGKRQVISAGHCIDTDGNGTVIDITAPGNDVRVLFNSESAVGSAGRAIVTAVAVSMDPNYKGFGKCPVGVAGFCVNDDVAVITLGADAPATAKIYKVATNPLLANTRIMMAGYGTSGDGISGYNVSPNFRIKRQGENYTDFFDLDDEANRAVGSNSEVYYADFDGTDAAGVNQDTFCTLYGACSPQLPNHIEAGIGGGDSGGPSFVMSYGEMMLAANNTFSGRFNGQVAGTFGTYFGGIVLGSYTNYLNTATNGQITFVPEPTSIALFGLGVAVLFGARRRSIKK